MDIYLPPIEGDKVIQIGSCLSNTEKKNVFRSHFNT